MNAISLCNSVPNFTYVIKYRKSISRSMRHVQERVSGPLVHSPVNIQFNLIATIVEQFIVREEAKKVRTGWYDFE